MSVPKNFRCARVSGHAAHRLLRRVGIQSPPWVAKKLIRQCLQAATIGMVSYEEGQILVPMEHDGCTVYLVVKDDGNNNSVVSTCLTAAQVASSAIKADGMKR